MTASYEPQSPAKLAHADQVCSGYQEHSLPTNPLLWGHSYCTLLWNVSAMPTSHSDSQLRRHANDSVIGFKKIIAELALMATKAYITVDDPNQKAAKSSTLPWISFTSSSSLCFKRSHSLERYIFNPSTTSASNDESCVCTRLHTIILSYYSTTTLYCHTIPLHHYTILLFHYSRIVTTYFLDCLDATWDMWVRNYILTLEYKARASQL